MIHMADGLFSMEADFFKALAHPTRIRIIKHLAENERCVCEFTDDLDIEQSNISQHLAVLRKQGIVSFRKDVLRVMYKVSYPQILEVIGLVDNMLLSRANETFSFLRNEDGSSWSQE